MIDKVRSTEYKFYGIHVKSYDDLDEKLQNHIGLNYRVRSSS